MQVTKERRAGKYRIEPVQQPVLFSEFIVAVFIFVFILGIHAEPVFYFQLRFFNVLGQRVEGAARMIARKHSGVHL